MRHLKIICIWYLLGFKLSLKNGLEIVKVNIINKQLSISNTNTRLINVDCYVDPRASAPW